MKTLFKLIFISFIFISIFSVKSSFASSGAYLAAVSAVSKRDYNIAVEYYDRLIKDFNVTDNTFEEALIFSLISGNLSYAQKLSILMEEKNFSTSLSSLVSISKSIVDQDYKNAFLLINNNSDNLPNIFVKTFDVWYSIFINSKPVEKNVKKIEKYDFTQSMLQYQKAMAFALKNDFKSSASLFNLSLFRERNPSENEIIAWVQILSENNENDKAIQFLNIYKNDYKFVYRINEIINILKENKVLDFNVFSNPWDSISDVLYQLSSLKNIENNTNFINIFYLRIASFNSKNKDSYIFSLGKELQNLSLLELSNTEFEKIKRESFYYYESKLQIVDNYFSSDQILKAQSDLKKLLNDGYYKYEIFESLGDSYRLNKDYKNAVMNYTLALNELKDKDYDNLWFLYFVRGISYEQNDQWSKAKLDLEKALEIRPNQPQILNYLGYSLIEKQGDLNEALKLIKKALIVDPDKGYIIDSYGWCLYKLGRIEESLNYMEKAIELEPTDPVVNDHLGDVLWKVGRKREALFQWKRALTFNPNNKDMSEIQYKIKNGLVTGDKNLVTGDKNNAY